MKKAMAWLLALTLLLGTGAAALGETELSYEGTVIAGETVPVTVPFGGRVSGVTAKIATILNIKPVLYGDETGHIVACEKVRGRRRAIEAVARKFAEKREENPSPRVYISHGDCEEDAEELAARVREAAPGCSVTVCQHEPVSGAHVGPGMLALFFVGKER